MNRFTVLAFDLGASSGRAIKAQYQENMLTYEEIYRFENNPVTKDGIMYWDFEALKAHIMAGIEAAGAFDSVGFDTWGVDFGLLDENGELLEWPVHYRDTRTNGMPEKLFKHLDKETLYKHTGNQIMAMNTLFQLMAVEEKQPELLKKAKTLLFMPDLLAYELTGNACCEMTIASTSQMFDPKALQWSDRVLEGSRLPASILLPPVPSGTVTGSYKGAKVIAVAGHDTQCAVAAMPVSDENAAFLSCGTWSLLGAELDEPVLTKESLALELSNEIGANGKINYLKNIIGLWLVQESRRQYRRQGLSYSFSQLEQLALEAEPLRCFIDPDSPEFGVPGDIPERIRAYCQRTGQYVPKSVGEIVRCINESLALKYRYVMEQLEHATGKKFSVLHILGGGIQSRLLCQLTANSSQLPVIAGPVEATALGNIIIQLVVLGALKDIDEGRKLIAKNETLRRYQPEQPDVWNRAYESYKKRLKGR